MSSVPWSFTWQIPEPIKTPEDRLAEAAWTRCRSLSDRKSGQTWDDLDWEVRKAWKDGVIADLNAAGVYLTKRKERT
jgi:hypothetical protein